MKKYSENRRWLLIMPRVLVVVRGLVTPFLFSSSCKYVVHFPH
jgi:hypothetical protein